MRVLQVVTEKDSVPAILARVEDRRPEAVYLCAVEYGCRDTMDKLAAALSARGNLDCRAIDFLGEFNRNAFDFKEDYLKFIYELGRKNLGGGQTLREYFRYPSEDFSLWWFSLTEEKGPHKSESYTYFVKLLTLLRLKHRHGCQEIWTTPHAGLLHEVFNPPVLSGNSRALRFTVLLKEFLKTFKLTAIVIKRIIELKILTPDLSKRKEALKSCDMWAVTSFPFLDMNALKEGKWVNKAYGALQSAIEKYHPKGCVWLCMYAYMDFHPWNEAVRFLKILRKGNRPIFMFEEWLGLKDVAGILKVYWATTLKFFQGRLQYSRLFDYRDEATKETLSLWPVYQAEFCSSFMGKILLYAVMYCRIFSNAVGYMPAKSKIIHYAEMHPWEKAIKVACLKRRDIISVGLQHTIVPLLLLNYFHHPEELKGADFINRVPVSDRLACVGRVTEDIFVKSGWKNDQLFILGGFRFQNLGRHRGQPQGPAETQKNQLVVAFSLSPFENAEILRLLHDAFNNKTLNFTVLLKGHPCDPIEETAKRLNLKMSPKVFQFTTRSLPEIVPESKAMVVKESSSAFEALMAGIPVIVPNLYNIVDLCPLSGVSDLPIYVNNADELYETALKIFKGEKAFLNNGLGKKFIENYLHIQTDDKVYYDNLMKACAS